MATTAGQKSARTLAAKAKEATSSGQEGVLVALGAKPRASVAEVAVETALGRSTVSKLLVTLERGGVVRRTAGGREGPRRLPDRWELAGSGVQDGGVQAAPGAAGGPNGGSSRRSGEAAGAGSGGVGGGKGKQTAERLPAGALGDLVLAFMRDNADDGPLGPAQIGKGIGKSSGAVANSLVRLARDGKVRQVGERPIRYVIAE